jgi:hypothetical protein
MKRERLVKSMTALPVGMLALIGSPQEVTTWVDARKTGPPISKNMYGFFTGLQFNIYTAGLRAEMLGDQKFFIPLIQARCRNHSIAAGLPRDGYRRVWMTR